jgi:hypothetical protein
VWIIELSLNQQKERTPNPARNSLNKNRGGYKQPSPNKTKGTTRVANCSRTKANTNNYTQKKKKKKHSKTTPTKPAEHNQTLRSEAPH